MDAIAFLTELASSPVQTLVFVVGGALLTVRAMNWIAGRIAYAIVRV